VSFLLLAFGGVSDLFFIFLKNKNYGNLSWVFRIFSILLEVFFIFYIILIILTFGYLS